MGGRIVSTLPSTLGMGKEFVTEAPTYLVVTERGREYTVLNLSGEEVVRVESQDHTRSKKKKAGERVDTVAFYAPKGELLYTLQSKFASRNMYLASESGERICCISGRPSFGKDHLSVYFTNTIADGQQAMLDVRGHLLSKDIDITWNGASVGRIGKKFPEMGDVLAAPGTMGVQVAPGADLALIAAIVVALSEKRKQATLLTASVKA